MRFHRQATWIVNKHGGYGFLLLGLFDHDSYCMHEVIHLRNNVYVSKSNGFVIFKTIFICKETVVETTSGGSLHC
jgi:hypothetical protein